MDPLFVMHTEVGVACLKFSNCGQYLYSGDYKGKVAKWNLKSYRADSEFQGSQSSSIGILSIDEFGLSPDSSVLIQDRSGCYKMCRYSALEWTTIWQCTTTYTGFCRFCAVDNLLIVPLGGAKLAVWQADTGQHVIPSSNIKQTPDEILAIRLGKIEGREVTLVVGGDSGDVFIVKLTLSSMDWQAGQTIRCNRSEKINEGNSSGDKKSCLEMEGRAASIGSSVLALAVDADDASICAYAAGPQDKLYLLSCLPTSTHLQLTDTLSLPHSGVGALAVGHRVNSETNRRNRVLLIGFWDGKLVVRIDGNGHSHSTLNAHDSAIQQIEVGENLIAACCSDGRISIWNV